VVAHVLVRDTPVDGEIILTVDEAPICFLMRLHTRTGAKNLTIYPHLHVRSLVFVRNSFSTPTMKVKRSGSSYPFFSL